MHFTVLSTLLTSVCIVCLTIAILLLGYEMHTHRTSFLATARNGEHVLNMTDPFSRKASLIVFRGQASSPRMTKGISVPLPPKIGVFFKVDSESSKK
jgi:hypothetical protein